ncbi:MAG: nucleotidyl transferase AbiEii/AbiGii toxin family protein [Bacteroidetes bacterium]|nr:nucleotidyl transferase AbiEii/AbiGii toxin family protein [Bacteroidota bacterium]
MDIAIINNGKKRNEIKTIIRMVEKEMTTDLKETQMEGVTSKGSKFRKSVFEYPGIDANNKNNKLIVEVNSFSNTFPFQPLTIKSFVYDFLMQTGNEKFVEQYGLQPFMVNVLNKEQTLLEKLVSLVRFSLKKMLQEVSQKIRHFYDLYFLMNDAACAAFY